MSILLKNNLEEDFLSACRLIKRIVVYIIYRGYSFFYKTKNTLYLRKENKNLKMRKFGSTKHHVFFGYYDITPFSIDGRYLLAMRYPTKNILWNPEITIEVGYYDLNNAISAFNKIDVTSTWCWQQGCRLQWYSEKSDRTILYNKLIEGQYGCVIQEIETKRIIKYFDRPVYTVSKDGKWSLSLNFSRLHRLRPGYGYTNLPDETEGDLRPENDGIWRIDMKTSDIKLLFSIAEIALFEPLENMNGAEHYFNHVLFNPAGTRFMFFHLWIAKGKRYSRLITCDINGNDRYALVNEGYVSHYAWKSNHELLAYSMHPDTGTKYHLYEDKTPNRKIIGEGVLNQDGHPSYSRDCSLLLTDTYPDNDRKQQILIYKPDTCELKTIGVFYSPYKYRGENRCDLHPRWSPDGRCISFDSEYEGKRAMYIIYLS